MTFGIILKQLRKQHHMTQEELAQKLNVAKSTISMYEQGERVPSFEIMKAIADIFNTSLDVLYGREGSISDPHANSQVVKVPVYGSVAAGIPIEAITDIEDYEEIPADMAALGEYAALKIKGDSMEPRMTAGDVVIVRIQETVETGDTAIVMINGDEATCKKVKRTEEGIILISSNPKYEPIFFSNRQIEELPIRIFGKVVELRAKY